jgi:hypothetical protein
MHHLAGIQPASANGLYEAETSYWHYARIAGLFGQFLLPFAFAAAAAASAYEQWRRRESVNQQQMEEMLLSMENSEEGPRSVQPPLMPGPACPECGKAMRRRVGRRSAQSRPFWGCTTFPQCRGTLPL